MTEDKARRALALLNEIAWLKETIRRLRVEREAKLTGLDPRCPGPKSHVLETLKDEWDLLGEKCVAFFITAMEDAIVREERHLASCEKELERL